MTRLWVRIVSKHKIIMQDTVQCEWENIEAALTEICRGWDMPCPVWLNKHVREMDDFRRTAFRQEHFMEEISFDGMEIEFLEDLEKPRRSQDPRNQF